MFKRLVVRLFPLHFEKIVCFKKMWSLRNRHLLEMLKRSAIYVKDQGELFLLTLVLLTIPIFNNVEPWPVVAQLVAASSHKLKGHGFNSQSGHMPRLWVKSLDGVRIRDNQ